MTNHDSQTVVVIGAGLGGLASACTLAARGYRVRVFETNSWVGGKAAVHRDKGFRFDMGPTIVTVPSVLRRIFGEAGRPLESALNLVKLDPQWRSFFEDGSTLDLVADGGEMSKRIEAFAPGSRGGEGFRHFLELSKKQSEISERVFFWKPVGGFRDMFKPQEMFTAGSLMDVFPSGLGARFQGYCGLTFLTSAWRRCWIILRSMWVRVRSSRQQCFAG